MSRPSDLRDVIDAILALRSNVVRWMSRWGYQAADAQDLAQQTTEQSVRAADAYDPARGAVKTWLYMRARDVAKEHAERIAHHANTFWGELGDRTRFPSPRLSPEEEVGGIEVLQFVLTRLRSHLPEKLFDVLVARVLHEFEEDEVAEAFGWPIGTVRSRLRTAIRKAKECLVGYEHELRSVMPLIYEVDSGVTTAAPVLLPRAPRLRVEHALLVPAVAVPLLLLPRHTVLLSAQSRPIEVTIHLDAAGASEPAPPPACQCPATVCTCDEPVRPSTPRAHVRDIDRALERGDEPGARDALLRYLRAYPSDPLGVRGQFGRLLPQR
ncbi:RNA polymerase sigma factor [Polyangium aurulentum]|uniref:RNA polymerase sigma factor n=1 Tax=Polyangium aurulentum TaxID=2567896 RepID=UPI0010AEB3D5|nr:sigma-70 family RNA polymerase sigma factor [Polyangium aurulentum]UQA55548.1 sigma-70 family RNA polymerase sigma factor [Polyangium aurulentum]